jgi:hypothetical protein
MGLASTTKKVVVAIKKPAACNKAEPLAVFSLLFDPYVGIIQIR